MSEIHVRTLIKISLYDSHYNEFYRYLELLIFIGNYRYIEV